jgi:hypothetical protein
MTHTLTKARRAVKHAQPDGAFLPAPRQVPNSPAEVGFSPSGSATGAAVRRDAPNPFNAAQARLNDVAARTARLQAKYTKTRTHEALYDLKRARVALVAASNDVMRFNAD